MILIIPINQENNYLDSCFRSLEDTAKYCKVYPIWGGCTDEFIDSYYEKYPFLEYREDFIVDFTSTPKLINLGLHVEATGYLIVKPDSIFPSYNNLTNLSEYSIASFSSVDLLGTYETIKKSIDLDWNNSSTQKPINTIKDCFYINSKVIEEIGYLDDWFKYHYSIEDYAVRAGLKGFKLFNISKYIHSYGEKLMQENYILFNRQMFYIKYSLPLELPEQSPIEYILKHHLWKDDMRITQNA